MAVRKTAQNEGNKAEKNKANKQLRILNMAAKTSSAARRDMLNALSDDSAWEDIPSASGSVRSTMSRQRR